MKKRRKHHILVADDAPAILRTLAEILREDYDLSFAATGREVLELAAAAGPEEGPDLILLDIAMPGMDGYDVCRQLRSDPATQEIPVVFVTGATDDAAIDEAFGAGASDYIRKPISRAELTARVRSILSHQELIRKQIEEEKLQGVLEMAGAVCHELNQPLQSLTGFVQLLGLQTTRDDPRIEYVEIIQDQLKRMAELTRKLNAITCYETVEYIENTRIIDIDKAIGGALRKKS